MIDLSLSRFFSGRHRQSFETSHTKLELCDGSDDLLVLFSSRNSQKFQGGGPFSAVKSNKLYLVDRTGTSWYQEGIPGFGNSLAEVAAGILALKRDSGFRKVTLHGCSMGAYAAVTIGAMAGVDRVFAVSPQVRFNPGWSYVPPEEVVLDPVVTADAVARATGTKFDIMTSSEVVDVYHTSHLAGLENVNIGINCSSHNVLRAWKINGTVTNSLEEIMNDRPLSNYHQLDLPMKSLMPSLQKTLGEFYLKKYAAAAVTGKQLIQVTPDWYDAHQLVGKCHLLGKEFTKALPFLSRSYQLNSLNLSVYRDLIMTYLAVGARRKAEDLLMEYIGVLQHEQEDVAPRLSLIARSSAVVRDTVFAKMIEEEIIPQYQR